MEILLVEKQVFIVTGAAMGIGAACAELLNQNGAQLVLVDIQREHLVETAQKVDPTGNSITIIVGDTSDPQTAARAVAAATDRWGKVDGLVNNAAINFREKALDLSLEHWDRIMEVNMKGYFLFAREAAKAMVEKNKGSIVNISSELSLVGSKTGQLAYSTAKGGINQMTRTLAAEWAEFGIRVNAVAPGLTDTPLVQKLLEDESYRDACIREVPLKRLGQPVDIAQAVLFLSSHWADFITGQMIVVDGGYTSVR